MRILWIVLALVLPLPATAARFAAPDETASLFRRDLLPIDTDTMRALSAQLTTIARRGEADSAQQLRATAQLLAIAMRLDPANRSSRDLSKTLAAGSPVASAEPRGLQLAKAEAWHITDWLLQDDAGGAGQQLGQQLLDALRVVDPTHPSAGRHDRKGEAGRWKGVVAAVERFGTPTRAEVPTTTPGPATPPKPKPAPPEPPPTKRVPVQLRDLTVSTPLFLHDSQSSAPGQGQGQPRLVNRMVPLSLTIVPRPQSGEFALSFVPVFDANTLETIRTRVHTSLEQSWSGLPLDEHASLGTDSGRYANRNGAAVSGPLALLLHAALAGNPLRDDLVFIGELREDGSLARPRHSWDYLRQVRAAEAGGRLVVPPDLLPELRSFLVMEDPGFFIRWEVLVVSSLDAALGLCSMNGDPVSLAEASALFAEIRTAAQRKDVGQLSVDSKVRARLAEIKEKAPFHLSAAMILLQGSSMRPTRLERPVLARILRSAVEPLAPFTQTDTLNLDAVSLQAAHTACRRVLDPLLLERQVAKDDLPLHKEAVDLANLARSLASDRKQARTDLNGQPNRQAVELAENHSKLKALFPAYLRRLAALTGDSPTEPGQAQPQPPGS